LNKIVKNWSLCYRQTWLRTADLDVKPKNLGLRSALDTEPLPSVLCQWRI